MNDGRRQRQVTPQDVTSYMKEDFSDDGEEIDRLRRQMSRIKEVLEGVIQQLTPTQLLAVSVWVRGSAAIYDNRQWIELTDSE